MPGSGHSALGSLLLLIEPQFYVRFRAVLAENCKLCWVDSRLIAYLCLVDLTNAFIAVQFRCPRIRGRRLTKLRGRRLTSPRNVSDCPARKVRQDARPG